MARTRNGGGSEKREPSLKLRRAIGALLSGEAKTQKRACEIADIHPSAFSKRLKDPHVKTFLQSEVRQRLSTLGFIAAANVLETLMRSANSEYVRADAAKHVLAINGVKPSTDAPIGTGEGIKFTIVLNGKEYEMGRDPWPPPYGDEALPAPDQAPMVAGVVDDCEKVAT